ncbi:hypothetical protein AO287_14970 [Pseudomonas savastanoi]|uniref:Uncharacterized protein n=1 Tax=Pseudomonas savastanoi TaxID=29438 RepID=A0AAW3M3J2_PSESS|nr:hypothetical protein AO287_14970 [Pseudomonas savastanoi]
MLDCGLQLVVLAEVSVKLGFRLIVAQANVVGDEGTGLVTKFASLAQREFGIAAKRNPGTLSNPGVAEVPGFAANRGNVEEQTIEVCEGVGLVGSLGLPDDHICEHACQLLVLRVGCDVCSKVTWSSSNNAERVFTAFCTAKRTDLYR